MKLGEALTLRARQAQKLGDLANRARANARAQEGDDPPEDSLELIDAYVTLSLEQATLIGRITTTNVQKGLLPDLLTREHLKRELGMTRAVIQGAQQQEAYYSRSEIKWVSQVDVSALQARVDKLELKLNALDASLQARNWEVDLVE